MGFVNKLVKQTGDTDCSIACLTMIASAIPELDMQVLTEVLPHPVGALLEHKVFGNAPRYAPTADELAFILNELGGCCAGVLRSDHYYRAFFSPEEYTHWQLANRLHYTQAQLQELAENKMALLVVRSSNVKSGFHLVLWDCDRLLDPDPAVIDGSEPIRYWDSYEVVEVILIWNTEQLCRPEPILIHSALTP